MASTVRFTKDAGTPTLQASLISYWKLTETSGTRFDLVGGNHLTDNATVTQARGRGVYAFPLQAQFTSANSEYLSIPDNAALSTGDIDFSFAAWVYLDTKSATRVFVCKGDANSTTNIEYALDYSASGDRFRLIVGNGAGAFVVLNADTLGSPSTGTWYFIVAWHDSVADTVNISVNNGAVDSASYSSGSFNSTFEFTLGTYSVFHTNFQDGRIAGVGFWKKVLSATERTNLYNSGNGSAPKSTSFSPDAGSNLSTDLISYWKLDEASGTRLDSYSNNDLTDNATVTQNPGRAGIGYAGQFTAANSEYLSITDNAELSVGNIDFTLAFWVYVDSLGANRTIASKFADTTPTREWRLRYNNGDAAFEFQVVDSSGGVASVETTESISTGTWYFIVCWHDASADTINIQLNNGTVHSASHTTGVNDSTEDFRLGADKSSGSVGSFWDGRIDEVGFWKRILTTQERTDLYNGGNGTTIKNRFLVDAGGSLGDRLISQWNLNEASGTRTDSISGENLTDNNTVTQAAGKIDNAAQFTATNSEYLSITDSADLSTGDIDFTWVGWVYLDSKSSEHIFVRKGIGTIEYEFKYNDGDDRFILGVRTSEVHADALGSPSTATWYFLVAWHDSAANTINISANNGSTTTTSSVTGPPDTADAFYMGQSGSGGSYMDGRIDEMSFWKRLLTTQEKTDLYNSGNANTVGMEIAQLTSDVTTNFKDKMMLVFD